jgi:hypothetical protein
MFKSFVKFALIVVVSQIVTYELAGIIAFLGLGSSEFYPPSPHALGYLRNPQDIPLGLMMGAQALRGLLFALVLFPLRKRILELGGVYGALIIAAIVLVVGFLAASGGMIEHFVFFTASEYPVKFALITLVEVVIQTALLGVLIVWLERRFDKQLGYATATAA